MNRRIEKKIQPQKIQVELDTRGKGVILFAVWNFLQVFLNYFTNKEMNAAIYRYLPELAPAQKFVLVIIVGGMYAILGVYVGQCAISYSHGGKLHPVSLVLAGGYALFALYANMYFCMQYSLLAQPVDVIVDWVVDVVPVILYIQIIVFSCILKKVEA